MKFTTGNNFLFPYLSLPIFFAFACLLFSFLLCFNFVLCSRSSIIWKAYSFFDTLIRWLHFVVNLTLIPRIIIKSRWWQEKSKETHEVTFRDPVIEFAGHVLFGSLFDFHIAFHNGFDFNLESLTPALETSLQSLLPSRHDDDDVFFDFHNSFPIITLSSLSNFTPCSLSNTLISSVLSLWSNTRKRRVALGITCVQCTPVQLELLRRAGAMPVSSRRCGMITKREAERLCKSFLQETTPPKLPETFSFDVVHNCAWGCRGAFNPSRYNSSRWDFSLVEEPLP